MTLFSKVMHMRYHQPGDIAYVVEVKEAVIPHPAAEEAVESRGV
jgi:hypothetical protein